MANNKNISIKFLLLELLCYVPLAIIAGNILPPIAFVKIHWIYIGIVFLLALVVLAVNTRASDLLLLILLFMVVQIFTSIKFSPIAFIDFISGPLVFIAVVNILTEDSIPVSTLTRVRKRMLYLFALPITIAAFQYIEVLPLEFMNARYVNATVYGGETIERVNGFLYHGIELTVIIFFLFASIIVLKSRSKSYLALVAMFFAEFITTIKTGIIAAILFGGFYAYFVDTRLRILKLAATVLVLISGFSYVYILIPDIQEQHLYFDPKNFQFQEQLFTGRGYIWNVYIKAISNFDFLQVLFGGGYGSTAIIFERNSTRPVVWSAGTHNQLLELLVHGGLFSILLIFLIIRKQYLKLSKSFMAHTTIYRKYFLAVLAIPLITMGITSPIMSMFVYWCGLSAVVISLHLKFTVVDKHGP